MSISYIDSNVFIYAIVADEASEKKALYCKKILLRMAEGGLNAATSSLTWDEVVWSVRKLLDVKTSIKEGRELLGFPNLRILNVDHRVLGKAQRTLEKYNLKPRDAIHAACCLENNIDRLISDDPDFDAVSDLRRIKLEDAARS
ncbi:MAG: type II toxin-antitoxin system VapC family toxin [Candidatus Micrarchaeaceae archaeon]